MARIIAAVLGATIFAAVVLTFIQDSMTPLSEQTPASVVIATRPTTQQSAVRGTNQVSLTGTLTYARNNVGTLIPYVVYQADTHATTRTLVFGSASTCHTSRGDYPCTLIKNTLSTYYPGLVTASGRIEDENLFVNQITD